MHHSRKVSICSTIHAAKSGSYQGDLSIDQANKLDILLSNKNHRNENAKGDLLSYYDDVNQDRSLIEDSCDRRLRAEFYDSDCPTALMRSQRKSTTSLKDKE